MNDCGTARRVLVIDDNEDMLNIVAEILRAQGYEVHTATEGDDGIRKVNELRPHVVLLDVAMPAMDGLTVLKAIRQIAPFTGVVMLSAINYGDARERSLSMGASDYITKPFTVTRLVRTLDTQNYTLT